MTTKKPKKSKTVKSRTAKPQLVTMPRADLDALQGKLEAAQVYEELANEDMLRMRKENLELSEQLKEARRHVNRPQFDAMVTERDNANAALRRMTNTHAAAVAENGELRKRVELMRRDYDLVGELKQAKQDLTEVVRERNELRALLHTIPNAASPDLVRVTRERDQALVDKQQVLAELRGAKAALVAVTQQLPVLPSNAVWWRDLAASLNAILGFPMDRVPFDLKLGQPSSGPLQEVCNAVRAYGDAQAARAKAQASPKMEATNLVLELDGVPTMVTGPVLIPAGNTRLDARMSGAPASPQWANSVVLKVDGQVMLRVAAGDPRAMPAMRVDERADLERTKQVLEQVRAAHRAAVNDRTNLKAELKAVDDLLNHVQMPREQGHNGRRRTITALIERCRLAVEATPDVSKRVAVAAKVERALLELSNFAKGDHVLTQRLHMLELYRAPGWPVWGL